MIFNKKRGAGKILSIYWFIILIIVVVGIYGMVTLYYNHPYDIRELEASILVNNVADCISYEGELKQGVFNESSERLSSDFKNNFLSICNITFSVENIHKWKDRDQYYIEVNFYDINLFSFGNLSEGVESWKDDCLLREGEEKFETFSKCVNKRFYSLYKDKPVLIEVFGAVRKTEKNVK